VLGNALREAVPKSERKRGISCAKDQGPESEVASCYPTFSARGGPAKGQSREEGFPVSSGKRDAPCGSHNDWSGGEPVLDYFGTFDQ